MTSKREMVALQFIFDENNYAQNLQRLKSLILESSEDAIIVAPELCLTHFSFDKLQEASDFSKEAIKDILEISNKRIIALSVVEEIDGKFYNSAKLINRGKIVHSQPKVKLFKFGEEDKYFTAGKQEDIKIIEIDNLKFAMLICFEIRFKELWIQIEGADIIMVPSLWGKIRKSHFEIITQALAVVNQAFIIAANSREKEMAKSSAIISPFGEAFRDDKSNFLSVKTNFKEIKKMRRYMDIGLK